MSEKYMELYEKLATLQGLLRRHHMINHAQRGPFADPTRGQGRVLAMLKLQPEISTKDLSYLLGIRQQSLNELLNKLEKSGLIARKPSEQDKRIMIVHLTDAGREARQEEREYTDIFSCLNAEEQEAFGAYLDRIIEALEAQLGDDEGEDIEKWMHAARERMGDEQFDRLMARRGMHKPPMGPDGRRGHPGNGRFGPHHGGHSGHDHRGHAPMEREFCGPRPDREDWPFDAPPREDEETLS